MPPKAKNTEKDKHKTKKLLQTLQPENIFSFNRIYPYLIYKTEQRNNVLCKQLHKYCEMTNKRHAAMESSCFYSLGFVTESEGIVKG